MRIEAEVSQDRGIEIPHTFRLNADRSEIVEVFDQWYGPDYRYCKVKGGDGALYILRLDENRSEWHLAGKPTPTSPRAQPDSHTDPALLVSTL